MVPPHRRSILRPRPGAKSSESLAGRIMPTLISATIEAASRGDAAPPEGKLPAPYAEGSEHGDRSKKEQAASWEATSGP